MTANRWSGFTLIELMAGVVIFTTIIATLFSALQAVRQTEKFRDDNVALTQAASYGFEPIVRSLKQANAYLTLSDPLNPNECITVRGFYAMVNGQVKTAVDARSILPSFNKIVTVTAEPVYSAAEGTTQRWVRREYSIDPATSQVLEKTSLTRVVWPAPLDECWDHGSSESKIWTEAEQKKLTPKDIQVTHFSVQMVAPVFVARGTDFVPQDKSTAPFVSVGLTVANPHAQVAPPVTFQTTITPTFSYGDQRE